MGIVISLVVGGLIGWLASVVMKTDAQMGILANVIIGIVGSALGFWIAGLVGFFAASTVARVLVSVAGAALLIFLLRALKILK